jgi:two-component system, sensor histidine kinase RegB
LRSRASSAGSRQAVSEWLGPFVEQWRLRHPHVKFELPGDAPSDLVLDDTVAVGQILTILLDNAARASRDFVTLRAYPAQRSGYIDFEVCDAGPGIPASLRTSIGATPVESTQGGHGVGLYLAFSSAARLGGSIDLADVASASLASGANASESAASAASAAAAGGARTRKSRGTRAVLRVPVKTLREAGGAGGSGGTGGTAAPAQSSEAPRNGAAGEGTDIGRGEGPSRPDAA